MSNLNTLALLEVQDFIAMARNSADVSHLKEDVFEYIQHLQSPENQKPDGMDLDRLAMRFIKLLEHCESVEFHLSRSEKWMQALLEAAKRQGGE